MALQLEIPLSLDAGVGGLNPADGKWNLSVYPEGQGGDGGSGQLRNPTSWKETSEPWSFESCR